MTEAVTLAPHPLDLVASMLDNPGAAAPSDVDFTDIRDQIGDEARRLRANIDHPTDTLVGWVLNDQEFGDWPTRFSTEEIQHALGVLSIINGYSEDVQNKTTPEMAIAEHERRQRVGVPIGPLLPISDGLREGLPQLARREHGRNAIHTARRIFQCFKGGSLETYQAALAAATQKEAEGDGTAIWEASSYIREHIAQQDTTGKTDSH